MRLGAAAFSLNGREIAAVRVGGAEAGTLWVLNADGSSPRRLTTETGVFLTPRWTSDGRIVAAYRSGTRAADLSDLVIVDRDGRVTKLTNTPTLNETQPRWIAASVTVIR